MAKRFSSCLLQPLVQPNVRLLLCRFSAKYYINCLELSQCLEGPSLGDSKHCLTVERQMERLPGLLSFNVQPPPCQKQQLSIPTPNGRTYMRMHTRTRARTHRVADTQTHAYTLMQAHRHADTHIHSHTYMQTHTHADTHTCRHTHMQTHTHTQTHSHCFSVVKKWQAQHHGK